MMEYTPRPLANDEMHVAAPGAIDAVLDDLQLPRVELGILNSEANVKVTVLPVVIVFVLLKLRS
jgi:hypothetical protein